MLVRRSRGFVSSFGAVGLGSIRTKGGDFRLSPRSATANEQNLSVYVSIRSGGTGAPQAAPHAQRSPSAHADSRVPLDTTRVRCALHIRSARETRIRHSDGPELRARRMRKAEQCEDDSYQKYDECFDLAQPNLWRSPSNRRRHSRRERAHGEESRSTQASSNR